MLKVRSISIAALAASLAVGVWAYGSPGVQKAGESLSHNSPVSVKFQGFTNMPVVMSAETFLMALFETTNNSASRLTCEISVDVYEAGADRSEFHTSMPVFLDAHSIELDEAAIPDHTNGLRFVVVLSPDAGTDAFQPTTNVWRTP